MRKSVIPIIFLCVLSFTTNAQWSSLQTINRADIAASDQFGYAVAIDGDYAVIGSPLDDDGAANAGSAYVFKNDGTDTWIEIAKLNNPSPSADDNFGSSVAIYGDYVAVGSQYDDDKGSNAGAVILFKNDGVDNFDYLDKLTASDGTATDIFGASVNLNGDYLAIGAPADDDNATNSGSVYLYKNDGMDNWAELQKITAADGALSDEFGWSVSMSNDYIIVGSYRDDDGGVDAGSAYIFKNDGMDNWTQMIKLNHPTPASGDQYGRTVSLFDNYIAVGVNGDDEQAPNAGSVFLYKNDGSDNWNQIIQLFSSDAFPGFGTNVSLYGTTLAVSGIGSQGSIYIFDNDGNNNWSESQKLTASGTTEFFGSAIALSGNNIIGGAYGNDQITTDAGIAYLFNYSTNVWEGNNNGDWTDAGNWSGGVVPGSSDDVTIPNTVTDLVVTSDVEVNDLIIEAGGNVTVSTNSLRVNSNLTNDGTITVASGSSLVLLGGRSGAGTETINRNLRGGLVQSMVGSPVANATVGDLNARDVYEYTTASQSFSRPDPSDPLTPGKGFFINGTSPSLTGTANTGTITIGVTTAGDGFNLVANPYAAAIDAATFFTDNAGVISGGQVYIWDDGAGNTGTTRNGDFVSVNAAGAAGAAVPAVGGSGSGTKGSGDWNGSFNTYQGFYVEASADGNVTFNPSQQITNNNTDVSSYRTDNTLITGKLRLALEGTDVANDILIVLDENGTSGVDYSLDAAKRAGNDLISFYSIIDDGNYAIQTLAPYLDEDINVKLGFTLAEVGSYTLKATELEDFGDLKVILRDALTGMEYDLRAGEKITFENMESTTSASRFSVVIGTAVIEQVLGLGDEFSTIKVYGSASSLKVASTLEGSQQITIHTLDGKVVHKEAVQFTNNEAVLTTNLQAERVYVLSVGAQSVKFIIK